MNNQLGVSPSKGNQDAVVSIPQNSAIVREKKTVFTILRSVLTIDSHSDSEVVGSIPTEVKRTFSLPRVVP